ncbi:phosphate ABC transporter permease subunit PstC [Leptothermofonsia sp. ETS-13]|uniref:phosphate ABC transporter permease subunit PstC n=1 Tax=Leptothermofonsia sp. ETS-13 TaxID=3035696 RepID=UPI003B9E04D2
MTEQPLQLSFPTQLYRKKWFRDLKEQAIQFLLLLAACSSIVTTISIMWVLISESVGFFQHVSPWKFLTGTEWAPLFEPPAYGILPLVCGTLVTSVVALAVAIPLGTIAALYLTEFASPQLRETVKPILELLAGIPTVVFGYFALLFVTPLLQKVIPNLPGFNMLSPGIVMGIMITPLISSVSEDAMRAVPVELREGSYATGATRLQTAWKVVFPAAISGISASYILGISRAVGETMIVAIAAGLQPIMTLNPLESAATITTYIVQVSLGDTPHGTPEYQTIFAAGLTLVIITLIFNIIGYFLSRRYRQRY